ncbi:MAG: hypothetical protein JKY32_13560 [Rhizobiales bacterium]|nr:hypothetical protein [Hyphomicrobiales bacterium]
MSLEILKEKVMALEMGRISRQVLPLDIATIDQALQGGLDLGAIHEFTGPAASMFAQLIVQRRGGTTFWLSLEQTGLDYYPAALAQYGGVPEKFLALYLPNNAAILNAAYEILASGAAGCVLLDLKNPLNQTQARKLQLAAQATSALGLVINSAHNALSGEGPGLVSSAVTRWHVCVNAWSTDKTRLSLGLTKNRRGRPHHWIVEIDHATHHLHLASLAGERAADPRRTGIGA